MLAAAEAVNCLSKSMLTELKSLPKPPAGVDKVNVAQTIQALPRVNNSPFLPVVSIVFVEDDIQVTRSL